MLCYRNFLNATHISRDNGQSKIELGQPNIKMGLIVTYCASLDEFLCAKFEISLETQYKKYLQISEFYGKQSIISKSKYRGFFKLSRL